MATKTASATRQLVLTILLASIAWIAMEPTLQAQVGKSTIDEMTHLRYLLPVPPKANLPVVSLLNDDLAQVPQVDLHEPVVVAVPDREENLSEQQKADLRKARTTALDHNLGLMARIRALNHKKTDYFLEALLEHRSDLGGLPFVLGGACRLGATEGKQAGEAALLVRACLAEKAVESQGPTKIRNHRDLFWHHFHAKRNNLDERFCVSSLTQIFAQEPSKLRLSLVQNLEQFDASDSSKKEVTRALTRLAIFSSEADIRRAATDLLRKRETRPANDVLMHGLRYPWPSIAQNTAEAVAQLKRTDLAPELVKLLQEPDQRAPVLRDVKGKQVHIVREVVRVNHLRNCLLCHPPGNNSDLMRGPVPTPGEALPSGAEYYREPPSQDIFVRADITYLRQDFSLMQQVAEAHPWPEMQRFDFLIRSRVLSVEESRAYQSQLAGREASSPYRQAALGALRRLIGMDAGGTAQDWRAALKLP